MEAGNVERRNVSAAMPGVWGCLVHAVDGLCGLVFFVVMSVLVVVALTVLLL